VKSSTTGIDGKKMNYQLGLRTLGLLMLVIASTAVLVRPELIGGSSSATAPALVSMLAVGHN
jgi:hypothetical protein